jgi:hypothetical protein
MPKPKFRPKIKSRNEPIPKPTISNFRHPVEYHNWQAGHNPWTRVLNSYVFPLNAFAVLICLPKFFESTVHWETTVVSTFLPDKNLTVEVSMSFCSGSNNFAFNFVKK